MYSTIANLYHKKYNFILRKSSNVCNQHEKAKPKIKTEIRFKLTILTQIMEICIYILNLKIACYLLFKIMSTYTCCGNETLKKTQNIR